MSTIPPLGLQHDDNPFRVLAMAHAAMQETHTFHQAAGCYVPAINRRETDLVRSHAERVLDDCTFGLQALGWLLKNHDGKGIGNTEDTLFQAGSLISLLADMQGYAAEAKESAQCRLWAHDKLDARQATQAAGQPRKETAPC